MLETDIGSICAKVSVSQSPMYTMRSLMTYFYQCQLTATGEATTRVFDAFFKHGRDAKWCRRQVTCLHRGKEHGMILWPPLAAKPSETPSCCTIATLRNNVFVPLIPPFMDTIGLRQCLSLYGVV